MNPRRMIEIRDAFLKEELVTHSQVIKPSPAPSQLNPYGDGCGCTAPLDTPTRPAIVRPSKEEYIRAFAADPRPFGGFARSVPPCVGRRRGRVEARLHEIAQHFRRDHRRMNGRLERALGWYDPHDLSHAYDVGRLARIEHEFARQVGRIAQLEDFTAELLTPARECPPVPLPSPTVVYAAYGAACRAEIRARFTQLARS